MSKMSELATALDEMTEVGRTLIICGENLLKAAAHVRSCFTEDTSAAVEEPAPVTEPAAETPATAEEPAPVTEPVAETPAPEAYTKEEVRAILADLSQNGFRNEAKALVRKYSDGGSLTDIDPAKYPDLVAEAEALHG